MLIRTIPFLVFLIVLILLPTGCGGSSEPPPVSRNIASAFKFLGCCSVVCSLVWAYAIINRDGKKGR